MSNIPKWKVAATALGFGASLSFAWPPSASPEPQHEATEPAALDAKAPLDRDGVAPEPSPAGLPVPAGLEVTAVQERGQWTVTVRHAGRLVALRAADAIAVGRDWATVKLVAEPSAKPPTMVWESTDAGALATVRGVLHVGGDGAVQNAMVAPPRTLAEQTGRAHVCRAHDDAQQGVSVICRVAAEAGRVRAANLLGTEPLEHAWVIPMGGSGRDARRSGEAPGRDVDLVRLDLPAIHGARAAAISYLLGSRAVLVRAEASRMPEEHAPSLFLGQSERIQPLPSWF